MQVLSVPKSPPLAGEAYIHGAKNGALPILAACVLCRTPCTIRNCPDIRDVAHTLSILRALGCTCVREGGTVTVTPCTCPACHIPQALAGSMRASILFLGALLARGQEASIALPGGCPIGKRPVDLHIGVLRALGAEVRAEDHQIVCRAGTLRGCRIELPIVSVGATEHAILAAVCARGCTEIRNAAREPEVADLARFLSACGADIKGAGTSVVRITGVPSLRGAEHTVLPDRIEAATYLCACAACGGQIVLRGTEGCSLEPVLHVLAACGCRVEQGRSSITCARTGPLIAPADVTTAPYPGFPTDAQAVVMAALLRARGACRFTETVFEHRFLHVPELCRLGAQISVHGRTACITGVPALHGAELHARDLRGGAALVLAALSAEGNSTVSGMNHIERGYDSFVPTLQALGAELKMVEKPDLL